MEIYVLLLDIKGESRGLIAFSSKWHILAWHTLNSLHYQGVQCSWSGANGEGERVGKDEVRALIFGGVGKGAARSCRALLTSKKTLNFTLKETGILMNKR